MPEIRFEMLANDRKLSPDEALIYVSAINQLLPQLSRSAKQLSWVDFQAILSHTCILIVWSFNRIIGMASLVELVLPSGRSGRIEDVILDKDFRGKGIGHRLLVELISQGKRLGLRHLDLTSKPQRNAANVLYRKLGFHSRDTNVYRLSLESR